MGGIRTFDPKLWFKTVLKILFASVRGVGAQLAMMFSKYWCRRRELNTRPHPYKEQGDAALSAGPGSFPTPSPSTIAGR